MPIAVFSVFLFRNRYLILLLMVAASLVNATVGFADDSRNFWTVLALQVWFAQAVFAYLRGGCVRSALSDLRVPCN